MDNLATTVPWNCIVRVEYEWDAAMGNFLLEFLPQRELKSSLMALGSSGRNPDEQFRVNLNDNEAA